MRAALTIVSACTDLLIKENNSSAANNKGKKDNVQNSRWPRIATVRDFLFLANVLNIVFPLPYQHEFQCCGLVH